MKVPIRTKHSNIRLGHQDKFEEREIWHKLVVKVIIWKDGIIKGGLVQPTDKITLKEWEAYRKRVIKTNVTYGREKVLSNLKDAWQKIKNNGGFEYR